MTDLKAVHHTHILTHSAIVGLTPLIPLPFVDEMAREIVQRRMIRFLASAHGLDLAPTDVKTLADEPSTSWLREAAVSMTLMPLKLVLRKTFIVLQGKRVVDLASGCYHRGFLVDHAFRERWCAPLGPRGATEVRAAIDAVCKEMSTAPVEYAVRAGLEQSRVGFTKAVAAVRSTAARARGAPPEAAVAEVVERAVTDPATVGGIVDRMRRSISDVPQEHFDKMRRRLTDKLAATR